MENKKKIGSLGEELTANYLLKHGYIILAHNYYSPYGEIDLIAKKENIIVFTEVKTRHENPLYSPAEAVTKAKQKRIIKTAFLYLQKHKYNLQPRFDVAEVILSAHAEAKWCINYIENAFIQEDEYAAF